MRLPFPFLYVQNVKIYLYLNSLDFYKSMGYNKIDEVYENHDCAAVMSAYNDCNTHSFIGVFTMAAFFDTLSDLVDGIANELTLADLNRKFFSAIVCAGGSGTRMSAAESAVSAPGDDSSDAAKPVTKQMIELGGMPVVVRTLLRFEECGFINEIIVAAREEEVQLYTDFREKYGITKLAAVVPGGKTRQESVANAFERVHKDADYIAVHDAARCLITPDQIAKVCHAALRFRAAAAASPARDTVKIADKHRVVESTPDRNFVWNVQTPQVFDINVYSAALHFAEKDGIAETATDDCMLAENIGFMPKLVDCGYENIKLTVPSDLIFAEAILKMRGEI